MESSVISPLAVADGYGRGGRMVGPLAVADGYGRGGRIVTGE